MLDKFRKAKQVELDMLAQMQSEGKTFTPYAGKRPSFADAIRRDEGGLKVIAEYKRASPSKGDINLGLSAGDVAKMYAAGGASAISVLTEEEYFKGSLTYLDEIKPGGLPMLRKDFLTDLMQIEQTLATPASALLVIVRMFEDDGYLKAMIEQSHAAGLDAVVEAFDEEDLARAKKAGAKILQINNRDLDTLGINMNRSIEFIKQKEDGEIWICASGISEPEDCAQMNALGYDTVLIGTSIMSSPDPQAKLSALVAGGAVMSLLVKVCGMTSAEDASMCEEYGADFLGFIFHPSSPRNVDVAFARSIKTGGAKKVGVFVKQSAAEVLEILKNSVLDFAQLHGGQNEEFCKSIGKERVIKVFWPQKYDSVKEFQDDIDRFAPYCSYMLFDAGKSGGGHGKSLEFDLFKEVTIPVPWLLAGGLSADNLNEALSEAKPGGVDLNSGVESAPGKKDKNKLAAAFEAMTR